MQLEQRKLLTDMLSAANAINAFVKGKLERDFLNDDVLRSGVYFKFAIIGEALAQLLRADPQFADSISDTAQIVGLRNRLIHGYGKIDDEIIWRIIELKLPLFIAEIQALLA